MRVRVKKWRVCAKGWTPFWKAVTCASAGVSLSFAGLFVWLVLSRLLNAPDSYASSSWDASFQFSWWVDFGRPFGIKPAVVPEPSRVLLSMLAAAVALMRRQR